MQCVWGEVGAVRPRDRAELIDKHLLKYGGILQGLEYGSEQAVVHFNDAFDAVIEPHGEPKIPERLYENDARHNFAVA